MSKKNNGAVKWSIVTGIAIACGASGGVESCENFGVDAADDDGGYYCADFNVSVDAQSIPGTVSVCDCVPTGEDAEDWLEAKCENEQTVFVRGGETFACTISGSPALEDSLCTVDTEPDPTGGVDGTAGVEPPYCTLYNVDTDECCDGLYSPPDCCGLNGDMCTSTVVFDPGYTAPGASPDYSASLVSATIDLTVHPGTGNEDSDSATATATASYDFDNCGETLCPVYVADLEFAMTENITVDVTIDSATKAKTISDFEGRLLYPTFGTFAPSSGDIEFVPNTLVFTIKYTVSGSEFDDENGDYFVIARNDSTITGSGSASTHAMTLDDLAFDIDVPNVNPVAELDYTSVSITDHPPSASASISSVTCIGGGQGRVTFDGTSTDSDSDLRVEMWWIDDTLDHIGSDSFTKEFSNGTHTYVLRAIDERGAFRQVDDSIVVSCN